MISFATLRQWMMEPPSQRLWIRCVRSLEQCPPEEVDLRLEYLQTHMAHWPEELRTFGQLSPTHPAWLLGRRFFIYAHSPWRAELFLMFRRGDFAHASHLVFSNINFSGSFMRALADADLPNLRSLEFLNNNCGPEVLAQLKKASWLHQLASLTLSADTLEQKHLGFLRSEETLALESLVLQGVSLDTTEKERLGPLTHNEALKNLRSLSIKNGQLRERELLELLDSPWLLLEELHLSGNHLSAYQRTGSRAMRRLAEHPKTSLLKSLDISHNGILRRDFEELLSSHHLQHLESLSVHGNELGAQSMKALAEATHLSNLQRLNISTCRVQDRGLKTLVQSRLFKALTELRCTNNHLSDKALSLFAQQESSSCLEVLDVPHNEGTSVALWALIGKGSALGALRELDYGGHDLRSLLTSHQEEGSRLPSLRVLNLSNCQLKKREALFLAKMPWISQLERVELLLNRVTPTGAEALAKAAPQTFFDVQLNAFKYLQAPHLKQYENLQVEQAEVA